MGKRARKHGRDHAGRSTARRAKSDGIRHYRFEGRKATVYLEDGQERVEFAPALDVPQDEISPSWQRMVRQYPRLPARLRPHLDAKTRKVRSTDQRIKRRLREMGKGDAA